MEVVNHLGGESKMTTEELVQTFNDQAVKPIFLVTGFSHSLFQFILFLHIDK